MGGIMFKRGKMKSVIVCVALCLLASLVVIDESESAAKWTFKYGLSSPGLLEWWDTLGLTVVKFSELVKDRTNGQVEVKPYYGNQFGGDEAMYKLLRAGSLEMATIHFLPTWDKRFNAFGVPYLVKEWDEVKSLYRGDAYGAKRVHDILLEHGVKQLAMNEYSFRSLQNTKLVVKRPPDTAGLRLRVPSAPLFIKFFEGLKVKCIPMPYTEIYTGLQRNTIDGQDNDVLSAYTLKWLEIPSYYTEINWAYTPDETVISKKIWDPLPQDIKDALKSSAEDASNYGSKLREEAHKRVKQEAEKKYGTKFYDLTQEDMKIWRDYGWSLWTFWESEAGSDEFLKLMKGAFEAGIPIPEQYKAKISK